MTSQPGTQTIPIHILTNISRSKTNQAMKFGQLTEYNFLKNHTKMLRRNYSQTFFKIIKVEHIYRSTVWSFIQFIFIVCQYEGYQNILKLNCSPLTFTSYKAFSKNKRGCGTSLSASIFCMIFEEKYFSCYILLTDQMSLSGCLYFVRYWEYMYFNCLLTRLWHLNFEINLIFLIKLFLLHDQKVKTKI